MNYEDILDTTQDTTKVFRIMTDFQDFLSKQSLDFSSSKIQLSNNRKPLSPQPSSLSVRDVLHNTDLKVKMSAMEREHASEKQSLVKSNIKLETECLKLNQKIQQIEEKYSMLELKNKQLTEQNMDLIDKAEYTEERLNHETEWKEKLTDIQVLQKEKDKLYEDYSDLTLKHTQVLNENADLQCEVNALTLQLEEALSIGELYQKKIKETALLMQEHQQTLCQLAEAKDKILTLSANLNEIQDMQGTIQAFKEDMNRLRFLEEENKNLINQNDKLKENRENIILLNEKLLSCETKLNRAQIKCQRIDELEAMNDTLQRQLTIANERAAASAGAILQTEESRFRSQSQELELLTEQHKTLQQEYEALHRKYKEEKQATTVYKSKIEEQTENNSSLVAQLSRLRKRTTLLSQERDSLRSILQSYDAELTMTSHTTQLTKRLNNEEEANKKLHERIENLESELKKNAEEVIRQKLLAKHASSQLTQAVALECREKESDDKEESVKSEKEIETLKSNANAMMEEKKTLIDKIEELEALLEQDKMKGSYDPRSEKVLHFSMNPADSARQKFKQDITDLQQENTRLKVKLKKMEEGIDVSVSEVSAPQSLKNELAMSELRNKRLKEIFSKKIHEFRQACYSLTGYRIDTSSDSKFKLVSMYAESQTDYLLFQMMPDGNMQLLETEFSKNLNELITLHLHHQNSIPMFLSAVSVNLFSQQTMVTE